MKYLNLGSIKIPHTAATKTFALLAKRGAGKTYTGAVIAEEFHKVDIPFVVFDPIDVWWGLRYAADGKSKGLPVVVFGLEHADIQIDRDMGKRIAQAIVKENISCVISTFGMPKVAQRHLIAEFAEELLRINNTPRHVFIEEAHEFVPQRVQAGMGKCFAAVESLVVMGRNRGIGVTLINQRAATLNKDVLTQVDSLLAFRNVAPQDRKALKEWVEKHGAEEHFNAFMESLPSLPTGEGWLWSPEFMEIFERIKIRKRETFHPDREKLGDKFETLALNQTDIKSFVESFTKKPEPKVHTAKVNVDEKKISRDIEVEVARRTKILESQYKGKLSDAQRLLADWIIYAKTSRKIVIEALKKLETLKAPLEDKAGAFVPPAPSNFKVERSEETQRFTPSEVGSLGRCAAMIYSFLYKHADRSWSKRQVGAATGYSIRSSGFENALAKLNTSGLIQKNGDSLHIGTVDASLATFAEHNFSIDVWLNNLGKCPREIYQFLLERPDESFTKEEVAAGTPSNYSVTSSGFENALSALNSTGLIKKEGSQVRLNPELLEINQ